MSARMQGGLVVVTKTKHCICNVQLASCTCGEEKKTITVGFSDFRMLLEMVKDREDIVIAIKLDHA